MSNKPSMLYILAPSYSGSTLLTFLLSQHPDICSVGELKANNLGDVSAYRCSCGEFIRRCAFWRKVTELSTDQLGHFSIERPGLAIRSPVSFYNRLLGAAVRGRVTQAVRNHMIDYLPGLKANLDELIMRNFVLAQIICEIQDGTIFLDGSKDAPRLLYFIRSGLWDIRVIYLQRDGRGVINSNMKHRGVDFSTAARDWVGAMGELQNTREQLEDQAVYDLKYEDVCKSPAKTFAEIWSWLGVRHVDMHSADLQKSRHHILGNTMRLGNVDEIVLDESWRVDLHSYDLEYFERRLAS